MLSVQWHPSTCRPNDPTKHSKIMVNNMYHMCIICNYQCTMFGDLWTLWSSILNKWVYICERTFTYTLKYLAPMTMSGVMTMENQTTVKTTPQQRSPQTVSYSLCCLRLLQFIIDPLWSIPPTALRTWLASSPPWDWACQPASTYSCMCGACVLPHHC